MSKTIFCALLSCFVFAGCSEVSRPVTPLPADGSQSRSESSSRYSVIHSFKGGSHGSRPFSSLAFVRGKLYGTTAFGGAYEFTSSSSDYGGTLYSVTTAGAAHVMHNFANPSVNDGARPLATVVSGPSGWLYGVTAQGTGPGTFYQIKSDGTEYKILHRFGLTAGDGQIPIATPVMFNGRFYGTTICGGTYATALCSQGKGPGGTAYQIDIAGNETVLRSFNTKDGAEPNQLVVTNGALYGVAMCGGAYNNGDCSGTIGGTVFRIDPNGSFTVLHSFKGTDGAYPVSLIGHNGTLFGLTKFGGGAGACGHHDSASSGCGVLFSISPTGKSFRVVRRFGSTPDDGTLPVGLLGIDPTADPGAMYGVTACGGIHGTSACANGSSTDVGGTVFRIDDRGVFTTVHSFAGGSDGSQPQASVVLANGKFYGTTEYGGSANAGTVFELTP